MVSSLTSTVKTFAGDNALAMYSNGSSDQIIISIFSPPSSLTILLTLVPLLPTQAPSGSTEESSLWTEILVR